MFTYVNCVTYTFKPYHYRCVYWLKTPEHFPSSVESLVKYGALELTETIPDKILEVIRRFSKHTCERG